MRVCFVVVIAALALAVFTAATLHAQAPIPTGEIRVPRQFVPLQGPGSQIGASVRELNSSEMQQGSDNWLTSQSGVVITEVVSWSPASRAGLMKGDVVTLFDRYRVRNVAHFSRLVGETPPGRTVKMTIVRSGKTHELTITPTL